jgi:polyisoprenoid-binding protein YceI
MRIRLYRCAIAALRSFTLALVSSAAAVAQQQSFVLEPAKTTVSFSLDATLHTVHGTFKATGGNVVFDPISGVASGSIFVDATSGDTGNGMRDHKMYKEVLESDTFPEIRFLPTRITGMVANGSTLRMEGILRIHGADHPITMSVPLEMNGDEILSAKLHFQVPYVAWGMKNPSTLILRVGKEVDVEVVAAGRVQKQPN